MPLLTACLCLEHDSDDLKLGERESSAKRKLVTGGRLVSKVRHRFVGCALYKNSWANLPAWSCFLLIVLFLWPCLYLHNLNWACVYWSARSFELITKVADSNRGPSFGKVRNVSTNFSTNFFFLSKLWFRSFWHDGDGIENGFRPFRL